MKIPTLRTLIAAATAALLSLQPTPLMAESATEKGEKLHENALRVIGEIRKKSWGNLTDEDYDQLVRIMDTIHQNVIEKQ